MFERILFPTDFSDYAEVSLSCLGELSRAGVEEALLLHVVDRYRMAGIAGSGDIEALQRSYQNEAEEGLEKVRKNLEDQGFRARVVTPVPVGDPAEEIANTAEQEGATLIFIGSRGKGILRQAFLGSVSSRVARTATVPVLLTKARVLKDMGTVRCEKACDLMFRKVLYPTDFSECSERVLGYIKEAIEAGAGIKEAVVLHVVEKGETTQEIEEAKRKAREGLKGVAEELKKHGVEVKVLVTSGIPSEDILKAAEEEKATIIMMGSRGMGFIRGMLLGSTSEKVVREGKVPVFLCRRKMEE
jgi:nucleotide-binding universal stress UspA family protein